MTQLFTDADRPQRTWLITPSFCKWTLLEQQLLFLVGKKGGAEHVIIDNHYPIQKTKNHENIRSLANEFGCTYVDSGKDLGLHRGINHAAVVLGVKPDDVVIGCDPDDRPSDGFVEATRDVMTADKSIAVLALMFWVIDQRLEQGVAFKKETIAGREVLIHPSIEMWNICGFNWGLVTSMGGLNQTRPYYGGLESALYGAWHDKKMSLAYLKD